MMGKPIEYWLALATGLLMVIKQNWGQPWFVQILNAAISAGIGHTQAGFVTNYLNNAWSLPVNEVFIVMLLAATGYLIVEVIMSLVSDREWIKQAIRDRISGGK